MSQATTVRVDRASHDLLKEMAELTGSSITEVLAAAIRAHRKRLFFEQANRDYLALREDPAADREQADEAREWDATLSDGLDA